MALLSEMDVSVCQRRVDSGSYKQSSGGRSQRKTKVTAKTKYLVVVSEKSGGPLLSPSDLNPLLILTHPSIPVIGRTCYSFGGVIAPFLLCSNKSIDRDAENPFVFHVSVDWESIEFGVGGGGQSGQETPQEALEPKSQDEIATTDDISPAVSFTTSSQEFVQYESRFAAGSPKRQSWKLPTSTPFEEPVVQKVPLITISITQFEDELTLTDLEQRSFTINEDLWNERVSGQWMIAEIQAEEVTLNLANGEEDKWRVTYTVHLAPDHKVTCVVDNEPIRFSAEPLQVGDEYSVGWATLRPLVDTFYKKEGPDGSSAPDILVPNADEKTGYVEPCYIFEATGRKREPTSTDGTGDDRPSYMAFMPFRTSNFGDFLQWPN
jgi:hypothetical protein